jgi:DNA-binding MarR family transcriptional regulator
MEPPEKEPPENESPQRDSPEIRRKRARLYERRRTAEQDLIDEITAAARQIAEARDPYGQPIFRTDGVWRVLTTVATSHYCLAIADLGRALGIRKQAAHELAHAAQRAQVIELATNHQDKRLLQALLTPKGRTDLAAARAAQRLWLMTLLNGLGDHEMTAAAHVVRVIRQRLQRDAREVAGRRGNG